MTIYALIFIQEKEWNIRNFSCAEYANNAVENAFLKHVPKILMLVIISYTVVPKKVIVIVEQEIFLVIVNAIK